MYIYIYKTVKKQKAIIFDVLTSVFFEKYLSCNSHYSHYLITYAKNTIFDAGHAPKSTSNLININLYPIFVALIHAVKNAYSIRF